MTTPAPERVDNPPPFKAKLGSYGRAPWHRDDDPVSGWEPEFRALAAALDYNRADGEWGIAFAHLRAGARRNLALCRAEQYRDFLEVLDDIHAGDFTAEERDVFLSSFRNRMATSETDQVPRIIDVTLRRLPVADKQRHGDPTRRKELMDPPTRAETLAALRLLRGVWIHAPASCAAAGDAGATEALTRCLAVGVPPSPRDSPADLLARALEQWKREGGWKASPEAAEAAEGEVEGGGSARGAAPPVKIAFPEGRGEDGESPRVMSIGWEVDDPEVAFGQPEEDEILSEVLEALLALLSGDERCREAFVEGGGVQTAASYLVPWLAEGGGEEAPSELVQRCIVFLGVLVRHVLPKSESRWTPGAREDARDGRSLAEEAEATLEATIGAEATREILLAAEELDPANAAGDVDVAPEEGWSEGEEEEEDDEVEGVADGEALLAGSMRALKVSGVELSEEMRETMEEARAATGPRTGEEGDR